MANMTHDLNIIARCTMMERGAKLEKQGLSGVQVKYMLRIKHQPGLTGEELARALYVNKSSAARQVAALESAGLVARRPRENDRRCLEIRLTEKGEAIMPDILRVVREWNDFLLRDLDDGAKEVFLDTLAQLAAKARGYVDTEVYGQ